MTTINQLFTPLEITVSLFWEDCSLAFMDVCDTADLGILNRADENGEYTLSAEPKWAELSRELAIPVSLLKKAGRSVMDKVKKSQENLNLWLELYGL